MKRSIHNSAERGVATDLFALQYFPNQLQKNNDLVIQQDGVLISLIHPFFHQMIGERFKKVSSEKVVKELLESDTDFYHYSKVRPQKGFERIQIQKNITEINARSYFMRLKNLLTHSHVGVIVLGEFGPYVQTTIALLREFGFLGNILLYETKEGESIPNPHEGTWDTLIAAILSLDLNKLIIAGQLTRFSDKIPDPKIPQGCVPQFAANVRARIPKNRKVEIIISPVTYPNWWKENTDHSFFRSS